MALSSIVIFTGGSAWNPFTNALASSTLSSNVNIVYVIPVSDDGGSTHELVRVLGGPGIGDLRSRIVRLARSDTPQVSKCYEIYPSNIHIINVLPLFQRIRLSCISSPIVSTQLPYQRPSVNGKISYINGTVDSSIFIQDAFGHFIPFL